MTADEQALCARLAEGVGALTPGVAAVARRHRVHLLLASALTPAERRTPEGRQLARELTLAAALHDWQEGVTRDLLDSLGEAGIAALLLKGTGLAYTVYAQPHLRPRVDVDLLVTRDALDAAQPVLAARGWTRPPEPERKLSAAQRHYVKDGPGALLYLADMHWSIANPRIFATALTFDELEPRSVPVAPLGQYARTLGLVDALLLACVHRVAHHDDANDLLWLWDIHLLMERLSVDDRASLVARAEATAMQAVCARGIRLASQLFGTTGAQDLVVRLEAGQQPERSSQFLGGALPITVLRTDLATLGWRDRAHLVLEHLFPPSAYMRSRYPRWPAVLRPLAYAYRIARGAPKWFRRTGDDA